MKPVLHKKNSNGHYENSRKFRLAFVYKAFFFRMIDYRNVVISLDETNIVIRGDNEQYIVCIKRTRC